MITEILITYSAEQAPTPWVVEFMLGSIVTRDCYSTEELALQRKAELALLLPRVAPLMRLTRSLAGTGCDPRDLINLAAMSNGLSPASKFADAAAVLLQAAEKRPGLSPETLKNYRIVLGVLCRSFGSWSCNAVTTLAFVDFITSRKTPKGTEMSHATKRTYRILTMMVLQLAGVANPLRKLPSFYPEAREVDFFTVEEVKTMFSASPARERGYVALSVYSCIAQPILGRLPAKCVNVATRTVTIPAHISPDGHEKMLHGEVRLPDGKILPGIPEVAWVWLERYPFRPVVCRNVQLRLKTALGRWIQDGFRRTAATYCFVKYGRDIADALLSHAGERLEQAHFVGKATAADAEAFYSIRPETISFRKERTAYGSLKNLPREELAKLLWTKPMPALAKDLKVSLPGLFKHVHKLKLRRPGVGYWEKQRAKQRAQQ